MKFDWTLEAENNIHTVGHEDWKGGELHVSTDLASAKLTKVVGTMDLAINPDEKIFMNGYQTWTVCPEMTKDDRIRGMHKIPKKLLDQYGFDRYGDYHFYDYPYERGVSHGYSWCYFRNGKNFRLFASLNEEPGYTMFRYDAKLGILTIERDCAGLVVNGNYQLFDLFFAEGSEQEVFDAWFKVLDLKRKTTDKIYGYSSWYNRYQDINETAIEQDLAGCRSILKPNDLFQVDDGWETFVGDWIGADQSKFPAGMKKIADEIHSAGFRAGLWLAPFVAEEKSELYQKHQDWFLKVNHANWWLGSNWSGFYALDIDKPEVQEYLRQVFHQVFDEWYINRIVIVQTTDDNPGTILDKEEGILSHFLFFFFCISPLVGTSYHAENLLVSMLSGPEVEIPGRSQTVFFEMRVQFKTIDLVEFIQCSDVCVRSCADFNFSSI